MSIISVGIEGYVVAEVRRTDGSLKYRRQGKNAIHANLASQIADALFTGDDIDPISVMDITAASGGFDSTRDSSLERDTDLTSCVYKGQFSCASVGGNNTATVSKVELKHASPGLHVYATYEPATAFTDIQVDETLSVFYTVQLGAVGGDTNAAITAAGQQSIASQFGGSEDLRRFQYLTVNGFHSAGSYTAMAQVKGTPTMSGSAPTRSAANQANNSTNHLASKTGGTIVFDSNNATHTLDTMNADATLAQLHDVTLATNVAPLVTVPLSNVKSGDLLDLKLTLTISAS